MGKTIIRAATAAATMGLSETVRAGVNVAKGAISGGDIFGGLKDAATFGASGALMKGKDGKDVAAANVTKVPDMADVQQKVAALVSDTADPLEQVKRRARTLLTGGLGVAGDDSVVRKTLLGV